MSELVKIIEGVSKTYGSKRALHNVSLTLTTGKIIGLVGSNGSGKTTTIRMMTGLISMTSGDIKICGHSIRTEREKALANIGAIVENPELYEYMTGMQNLKHFANMAAAAVEPVRIEEIVQLVELEHAIHKK
jgi:ABC-2 type transport system ATP-binding protein